MILSIRSTQHTPFPHRTNYYNLFCEKEKSQRNYSKNNEKRNNPNCAVGGEGNRHTQSELS